MNKQILSLLLAGALLCQGAILPFASFAAAEEPEVTEETPATDPAPETEVQEPVGYTHEISDAGLELIKGFEGFSAYPIWDYKQYSYGYGSYCDASTVYEDPNSPTGYATSLYPDGIPELDASILLKKMVDDFNIKLNEFLEANQIVTNQNQFDALASFGYNLGKYVWTARDFEFIGMLKRGEHLTDKEAFIEAYSSICHAGGQFLQGLYDRRMRELNIFYSPYSMSDPDADLYVVNITSGTLTVRKEASASASRVGKIKASKVIRIHEYSPDGKWGYTSYCGYYGWVSMDYLVSIDEDAMVTKVNANGYDDAGIHYTFDPLTMTAAIGGAGTTNSSGFQGAYDGKVYLTKYLLYNNGIYILNRVSATAFTNCPVIVSIYLPPSVTTVEEGAFAGSSLQIIYYTDGSYAKDYAKASPYIATDERCRTGHTESTWITQVPASATAALTQTSTCPVCKEDRIRSHVGIEIAAYPAKTEYKEGIAFDAKGLSVRALFSDGTKATISDYKLSGYNKNKLGTQTITVSYSIFTTEFTVQVIAKSLTGISISAKPKKLSYIEGQALDLKGLAVTAAYDNNTTATVTAYSVSGYDPNKIGKQTVTVTYNGKKATFTVTVRAKSLTGIQILDYPQTMEYFCGQPFSTDGLRLKLSYDNGTTETVTHGFEILGYNSAIPGVQDVTVRYGTKSQIIKVTVILNYLKSDSLEIEDEQVFGIPENLTLADLRDYFHSGDRIELLKEGKLLPDDAPVGTGLTLRLVYNGKVQDSATVIVQGDLTGDGRCTVTDFMMISDHLMGNKKLTALALLAGDLDRDGKINLGDYCALYHLSLKDDAAEAV